MSKVTETTRKYLLLNGAYNAVLQEEVDNCNKLRRVHESLRDSPAEVCLLGASAEHW